MTGPTAFFYYRDQPVGYDYELAQSFADFLGVKMSLTVAYTPAEMLHLLRTGKSDIVAYNLAPLRLTDDFSFWPIHERSPLVLMQHKEAAPVSNITELKEQKIHVVHNSVFERQLRMLNEETGGELRVVLEADTVSELEIVSRVNNGTLPSTVVYKNQLPVYNRVYKNVVGTFEVSVGLAAGWVTMAGAEHLNGMLDAWWSQMPQQKLVKLKAKYYNRRVQRRPELRYMPDNGQVSPYDKLFKRYAPEAGWDWRLLAALCYHESRFNPMTTSPMGAMGLMQLVPVTAKRFGLTEDNAYEPEASIGAGVQYIKYLQMVYSSVEDHEERIKFVLASYNAGPAHILDARALTRKYGRNDNVWDDVEKYLLLKSEQKYYSDPVCRYGYYKGAAAAGYVRKVLDTYKLYCGER